MAVESCIGWLTQLTFALHSVSPFPKKKCWMGALRRTQVRSINPIVKRRADFSVKGFSFLSSFNMGFMTSRATLFQGERGFRENERTMATDCTSQVFKKPMWWFTKMLITNRTLTAPATIPHRWQRISARGKIVTLLLPFLGKDNSNAPRYRSFGLS